MPIYEYKCEKCGKAFEELVRNASETPNCPSCGSNEVAKRMSAPASGSSGESDPCGGCEYGGGKSSGGHSCGCGCGCCH
ncbi:MAG: zinc ribbon domain-containing protein [Thermoguttaceae bacterium]|nr:zinc ribbon domain-containing protein [Thermoguttaceae bacterium]